MPPHRTFPISRAIGARAENFTGGSSVTRFVGPVPVVTAGDGATRSSSVAVTLDEPLLQRVQSVPRRRPIGELDLEEARRRVLL